MCRSTRETGSKPARHRWPGRYPARLLVRQLDAASPALKRAAGARDAPRTMKAANDVNAAVVDLTRASDTPDRVRDAWDRMRTTISSHVGSTVVSEFNQHIADQQAALAANDSDKLSVTAKQALTMMDQMQRLYYPDTEGLG